MVIKILDLFAGAGGLSLGFELVRDNYGNPVYELHRAVELDKHCCETLRKRHPVEKIIEGDLTDKKIHERVIKECKGKVSIVMGGIPCQSFSLLGPRSGSDKKKEKFRNDRRDDLYKEFHDIVSELKPKIFIIENVKGILSKKDTEGNFIIDNIIRDFEELGYNLNNDQDENKYMLLNSADYGVPQLRHRVIIIGIRNTWKKIRVPFIHPSHYNPEDHSVTLQEENGLKAYVTLGEAIKDLPYLQAKITRTGLKENEWENITTINKHRNNGRDEIPMKQERFDYHYDRSSSSGKDFLNFVRGNGYKTIDHHTARGQKSTDIKLFGLMRQGEMASHFINREPELGKELISYDMKTFTDKYRKQRYDKPCTTIFAHLSRDGNRFIHPTQSRTFTPREAARVQSFPDDVIFSGGMVEKFRQIGNAVPPLLATNIAQILCNIFVSEKHD